VLYLLLPFILFEYRGEVYRTSFLGAVNLVNSSNSAKGIIWVTYCKTVETLPVFAPKHLYFSFSVKFSFDSIKRNAIAQTPTSSRIPRKEHIKYNTD